jgi:branched-chain amino acid transport system substrate-binding protein
MPKQSSPRSVRQVAYRRRPPRWLYGICALVLAALACRAPASPTTAAPPSGAAPGAAQAQAEPIKIGALLSTTGTLGALGTDALPAVQIFVEETNAAGGINGRPLQVIHVDDESKPEQAVSAAKRLIQQEKVVAVVGPVSSVVGASTAPVANENKVPFLGCICYEGPITPYEFSIFPLNGMMENQAQFAREHNLSRLGIISQAGALAELVKRDHVPVLEREGLTVVGFEQFQQADTDLTPLLARLRSAGAEQVYVAATGTPAGTVAKNFKQLGYPGQYWTFAGNANQAFIQFVADSADVVNLAGLKILVYKELPDSDPGKARLTGFATRYVAKTGNEPGTWAAVGYDMMVSIGDAIRKGGSDPQKIRDALEDQTGLQLLTGVVNRGPQEHNGLAPEWLSLRIDGAAKAFTLKK